LDQNRDEVKGGWRKLHNKKIHDLYSSPSIIIMIKSRRMRWEGHVARIGEKRNEYRLLIGKPKGVRPLGKSRCRWVIDIKMDIGKMGRGGGGVDWIGLTQDRDKWSALVNVVMNLGVPWNAGKLSNDYIIGGLPSSAQFHRIS
jgi:hypothetical protein